MNTQETRAHALLRSHTAPSAQQLSRLTAFLEKKYGRPVELQWQEDAGIAGGFRIELGSEVIDWTVDGGLRELKDKLSALRGGGRPTCRAWARKRRPGGTRWSAAPR